MRWHIIRTLLWKEVLRQLANRGGIVLAALLIVAALLMTHFAKDGGQAGVLSGGLVTCYIDYWQDDAWVKHLRKNVPADLQRQITFRQVANIATEGQTLTYPVGSAAIQMRTQTDANGRTSTKIWCWDSDSDGSALAPYELWFWRESARYFQEQLAIVQKKNDQLNPSALKNLVNALSSKTPNTGTVEHERSQLKGGFDMRLSITSGLILFALFFSCVYLLPSLMCEEHERGLLLAQALSPASPVEILAAKFLFYPVVGVALAAILAGISKPAVLASGFFWLVLIIASLGSLGIGLTIACLARTQRTASMGALCYMLVMTLFLFICQQGNIPFLSLIALEFHCPRMLHAALGDSVAPVHWLNLLAAAVLALGWNGLATILFRERGWQ